MTLALSPEDDLLVRAAAPSAGAALPSAGAALSSSAVRWADVLDLAKWHRLSGLLRRYLKGPAHDMTVPATVTDGLRDAVRDTAMRNLQRQTELHTVLTAFAGEDIPAMLLKGAALLESVYPEVGLRPMSDLDILVPRSTIHRAQAIVQSLGYEVIGGKVEPDAEQRLRLHHHHFPLMKDGAVAIELHHHVLHNAAPSFDIAGYWERAIAGSGSIPHLLPSPEDLLLHIGLHFTQDRILRFDSALGQLADVVWTADRFDLDWDVLAARAQKYGVSDWLFLALYGATTLFGEIAPADTVSSLRPPSFRPVLGEHFIRHRVLQASPSVPLERLSGGARLLLFPTSEMLDAYVRPDEDQAPSLMRLRARRAAVLFRRLLTAAPWRRHLLADVRLSRWILTLCR